MNINHIGGAVISTPVSIISFTIAFLALVSIFFIKPLLKKKKIDMAGDLPAAMLVIIAIMGVYAGSTYDTSKELKADEKAFAEQLKNDYGFSTNASLSEVTRSANYERIVVFKDDKGEFEVRPHLDGQILTFFRNDNGTQLLPKS